MQDEITHMGEKKQIMNRKCKKTITCKMCQPSEFVRVIHRNKSESTANSIISKSGDNFEVICIETICNS